MPQNINTEYSGPFKKANLQLLDQYVAGPNFPTLGAWDRAQKDDLYVVKGTVGRNSPAVMIIVGVISSDKHLLFSHGNYSQTYGDPDKVGKAKLLFYIGPPSDDQDFTSDYNLAISRLTSIQNEIAQSDKREHFMESGGQLKMNFQLFGDKGTQPELLRPYIVADTYRELWASASLTMDNRVMPVFNVHGDSVDYNFFSNTLRPGTLVEVHFELRHYAIADRTSSACAIKSDTFSAHVHLVSVLKNVPRTAIPKSPSKKPAMLAQKAYKGTVTRSEQVIAASAFVPEAVISDAIIADAVAPKPVGDKDKSVKQGKQRMLSPSPVSERIEWSLTPPPNESGVVSTPGPTLINAPEVLSADSTDLLGIMQPLLASASNPLLKQLLPDLIEQLLKPSSPLLAQLTGPMNVAANNAGQSSDLRKDGLPDIRHSSKRSISQRSPSVSSTRTTGTVSDKDIPIGESNERNFSDIDQASVNATIASNDSYNQIDEIGANQMSTPAAAISTGDVDTVAHINKNVSDEHGAAMEEDWTELNPDNNGTDVERNGAETCANIPSNGKRDKKKRKTS